MKEKKSICVFVGLVKNERDEILLIKRSEEELPEVHGKWELPGGKADFGETPENAVEREIFEETGYKVKALNILPHSFTSLWEYPDVYQHTIIICFLCELISKDKTQTKDHHVAEIMWVSQESLKDYSFLPGVLLFISQSKSE